jgi:hypothetical protein
VVEAGLTRLTVLLFFPIQLWSFSEDFVGKVLHRKDDRRALFRTVGSARPNVFHQSVEDFFNLLLET